MMGACDTYAPTIEPLLLEKNFCPYLRLYNAHCTGNSEWRSDAQWQQVIEKMLTEQGVQALEIRLAYQKPVYGYSECPCGEITGHYAEVLVDEQEEEKLTNIGFKKCGKSR